MKTKHKAIVSLDAYAVSVDFVATLWRSMPNIRRMSGTIAKQLERAATSIPLNIAEAQGRQGKDRLYHYSVALGSAREAGSCLQLLEAMNPTAEVDPAMELLDRVCAMLWRLSGSQVHAGTA